MSVDSSLSTSVGVAATHPRPRHLLYGGDDDDDDDDDYYYYY